MVLECFHGVCVRVCMRGLEGKMSKTRWDEEYELTILGV